MTKKRGFVSLAEIKQARAVSNNLSALHRKKLEEICWKLRMIGEPSFIGSHVHYVIREGIWIPTVKRGSKTFPGAVSAFPDLIVIYHPLKKKYSEKGYAVPIELKLGNGRDYAITQLTNGAMFAEGVLGIPCDHGRYVHIDDKGEFISEFISRESLLGRIS